MNFESSTDAVAITSDEGDALVPGTQARTVAEQEANATGNAVTIRNPVTDEVLATFRPAKGPQGVSRTLAFDGLRSLSPACVTGCRLYFAEATASRAASRRC